MSLPPPVPERDAWIENVVAVYVALLRDQIPFGQVVYGDGEWTNILGTATVEKNAQGERYCDELGAALRRTLLDPVGLWGVLWPGRAGTKTYAAAYRWIAENRPAISWVPFRPISWAAVAGLAAPFFAAVRERSVVLVGPEHLRALPNRLFEPDAFVEVPLDNAWESYQRLAVEIWDTLAPGDLVLVAAGQATNLIAWELRRSRRDEGATLFDIGSALDPFVGVYSRRVHRDESWQDSVLPRNYPK